MAVFSRVFSKFSLQSICRISFSSKISRNVFTFNSFSRIYGQAKFFRKAFSLSQAKLEVNATNYGHEEGIAQESSTPFVHPDRRTVFVGKLNPISTEMSIKDYFSQFGEVEEVFLKPSKTFKKVWPYAYVQFKDVSSMEKVLAQSHFINMRNVRVDTVYDKNPPTKICVLNIPLEMKESDLREHFSQYGVVDSVEFVHRNPRVAKTNYCFVKFTTSDAALKALESPMQQIGKSQIEVKKYIVNAKKVYVKRRVVINLVPEGLTLQHLKDYFNQFGRLAFVDLIFHRSYTRSRDMAFLAFFDDEPVKVIEAICRHTIKGQEVIAKRATSNKGNKEREVQIFVDKIPGCVTKTELTQYFEEFGNEIIHLTMKRWGGDNFQSAIVTFSKKYEVNKIMARDEHSIDEREFIVKRIGWSA